MKNILITGGLGMIGSTVAIKLVNDGHDVTILDAQLPRYGSNNFNIEPIKNDIKLIKADIRDKVAVESAIIEKDIIFNFAAQVDHNYSNVDPILDLDINCKGHLTILESCKKYNNKVKIIYSGTRMQYGRTSSEIVSEDHNMNPLSIYGINKLTAEKYYNLYYQQYGIKNICFRITNPYGPRAQVKNPTYCILNWFIRQVMENKNITIFGDGSQKRDYIFIDDLAEAMVAAALNENIYGKNYNLGFGSSIKLVKAAQLIVDTYGQGDVIFVDWPKNWKNIESGSFEVNVDKIKNDLDWFPHSSINEGILQTIEYYKKYQQYYW